MIFNHKKTEENVTICLITAEGTSNLGQLKDKIP
jgi:hypothetical protein